MLDMAKKRKPGRPATGRKETVAIFARVSPELGTAFEAYLDSQRPRPTTNAVIEILIEDFLTAQGFWPPTTESETSE